MTLVFQNSLKFHSYLKLVLLDL